MRYSVAMAEITSGAVLRLRRPIRAGDAGEDILDGMRELYAWAGRVGAVPVGPPSTTYLDTAEAGEPVQVDFTLPVDEAALAGDSRVGLYRTRGTRYAFTVHHGDYRRIGAAYQALDLWFGAAELRPAGPPSEVYLVAPGDTLHSEELLTEIRVPVGTAELGRAVDAPVDRVRAVLRASLEREGFLVGAETDLPAMTGVDGGSAAVVLTAWQDDALRHALASEAGTSGLLPWTVAIRASGCGAVLRAFGPDDEWRPGSARRRRALRAALDRTERTLRAQSSTDTDTDTENAAR